MSDRRPAGCPVARHDRAGGYPAAGKALAKSSRRPLGVAKPAGLPSTSSGRLYFRYVVLVSNGIPPGEFLRSAMVRPVGDRWWFHAASWSPPKKALSRPNLTARSKMISRSGRDSWRGATTGVFACVHANASWLLRKPRPDCATFPSRRSGQDDIGIVCCRIVKKIYMHIELQCFQRFRSALWINVPNRKLLPNSTNPRTG